MTIIDQYINSAKQRFDTVVLPEGSDARILQAAQRLHDEKIANVVLLGTPQQIHIAATQADVDVEKFTLIDPQQSEHLDRYAEIYAAGPRQTKVKVARRLLQKPLFYGAMMLNTGAADAMVAGAANPTARVIEAGLMVVGLAATINTPSSFFLMVIPEFQGQKNKAMLFADCAVNIEPDAEQLADIALASAASAAKLLADRPRVAMLSFSTQSSAKHALVDKVSRAVATARERAPDLLIDGEFQADTALVKAVAEKKLAVPGEVAGQANVLIFPDLNSGNIAYKLTQYLAGAQAIGPFLQGFAKPICDLSRGAGVADIVAAAAIALAQS